MNPELLEQFIKQSLEDKNISPLDKSTLIKNVFDSKKANAEMEKAKIDTENAKKPQPKELLKLFIGTLAPMLTAFVLILTLLFQINQSNDNNKNQIQAAEDLAWRNLLIDVGKRNPEENFTLPTLIKSFFNSKKYGNEAREISIFFLSNIQDENYFKFLFKNLSDSISWKSYEQLVTLSNLLKANYFRANDAKDYPACNEINIEIFYVGNKIADLLKVKDAARPKTINLSGVYFSHQNLDSIDFSGVIISGTLFSDCSVVNSDFSKVAEINNPFFQCEWERTAWWRAKDLSQDLKTYLLEKYPKVDSTIYWKPVYDKSNHKKEDSLQYSKFSKLT